MPRFTRIGAFFVLVATLVLAPSFAARAASSSWTGDQRAHVRIITATNGVPGGMVTGAHLAMPALRRFSTGLGPGMSHRHPCPGQRRPASLFRVCKTVSIRAISFCR
jgi:hypothetical protein